MRLELRERRNLRWQEARDGIPTCWIDADDAHGLLHELAAEVDQPYRTLYDLTVIDERRRRTRDPAEPANEFTLVYHLLSYDRNEDVRVKVPLSGDRPHARSATDIWPAADWYEREAWDMFGVLFDGHPDLRRIL